MSIIGRLGLAGAHHGAVKRNLETRSCNLANGDLYVFPNASSTIDATKPLTFKWNTACTIPTANVDLYLYEPTSANGLIHAWTNVPFAGGSYQATLLPKWWNDTTTASLQMNIINSGAASWDTSSPAGPVFAINYAASSMFSTTTQGTSVVTSTAAAAVTQSQDAVFQNVSSTETSKKGISKGVVAAAVLIPILILVVIGAFAVRFWRAREQDKRRRWSQALSTHSNLEWEKGAAPGEKPGSILGRPSTSSARPMSFATTNRPSSSVYAVENNMAGAGAGNHFPRPSITVRAHSIDELNRSSPGLPDGQVRHSRISFAETTRPDRRSRVSLGGDLRPVLGPGGVFRMPGAKSASELATPNRKNAAHPSGSVIDDEEEINISPSQVQGPSGFGDSEMRRAGNGLRTGRRSILGLGKDDKNRQSSASALSTDDFKSAASARGSVDELRDLEAVLLMRRSIMSQHSATTQSSPGFQSDGQFSNPSTPDLNDEEHLAAHVPSMPTAPAPIAGSSTIAYGPDQMLAVYAARNKINGATSSAVPQTTSSATLAPPKPSATRQNSGLRLLTNLTNRNQQQDKESTPLAPAPGDMRSYVHLNKGTISSHVVDAMPLPGPPTPTEGKLPLPVSGRARAGTDSRISATSDGSYYDEEVGEAK